MSDPSSFGRALSFGHPIELEEDSPVRDQHLVGFCH